MAPDRIFFVNILNIEHKFMWNFLLIHWEESTEGSCNNDYIIHESKDGVPLKNQKTKASICW